MFKRRKFLPREAFVTAARGRAVRVYAESERDDHGPLANFAIYVLIACAILIGLLYGDLSWRFVIGVGFFAAIGLMAFSDVIATKPIHYYVVETTDRGRPFAYATPDYYDAVETAAATEWAPNTPRPVASPAPGTPLVPQSFGELRI